VIFSHCSAIDCTRDRERQRDGVVLARSGGGPTEPDLQAHRYGVVLPGGRRRSRGGRRDQHTHTHTHAHAHTHTHTHRRENEIKVLQHCEVINWSWIERHGTRARNHHIHTERWRVVWSSGMSGCNREARVRVGWLVLWCGVV
jgi:hypothetical protein